MGLSFVRFLVLFISLLFSPFLTASGSLIATELEDIPTHVRQNPAFQYFMHFSAALTKGFHQKGTHGGVDEVKAQADFLLQEPDFTFEDLRKLVLEINNGMTYLLPSDRPMTQIEEMNRRLSRQGIDFVKFVKGDEEGFDYMTDPLPEDSKKYKSLANIRMIVVVVLPIVLGPALGFVTSAAVTASQLASAGLSSFLEFQFVKPLGFGKSKVLGNAFWTKAVAKLGQKLPIFLNFAYPLACTLAGAIAAKMAGEAYEFSVGDGVIHPLISLITFGVLSFGFGQTRAAQQLKDGYTSRYKQFLFETVSVLILNAARVIAIAAAFLKGQEFAFEFLGATFNIGHMIGYSTHLAYAALISLPILLRDGIRPPDFLKNRLPQFLEIRGGLAYEDDLIRAKMKGSKEPGFCQRTIAWLSRRKIYSLPY